MSASVALPLAAATETVAFVGGGNMAEAIVGGLLSSGFPASQLVVSEPLPARSEYLRKKFPGVVHTADNRAAVVGGLLCPLAAAANAGRGEDDGAAPRTRPADVVVLALKPCVMREAAAELSREVARARAVVVSIAAGIRTCELAQWLTVDDDLKGYEPMIVRCMPNTPALVREGATALYAMPTVSDAQRDIASKLLGAVSETVWVSAEEQLDAVTGLSGSGPAYFLLLLEALEAAGVRAGLSGEVARKLVVQTCKGTAKMAAESPDSFAELRRKVTSPNGTTFAGLKKLTEGGMIELVDSAVVAATERSREMGAAYGSG